MAQKIIHTKKLHREILKRIDSGEKITKISNETGVSPATLKIWNREGLIYDDGNENWHCPHCNKEFVGLYEHKLHVVVCKKNPNRRIYEPGKPRKKSSEETKRRQSEARKKYLRENPQQHTYITLRNKESYPEKYFTEVFTNAGLNFQREVHCGTYSLDFYFPEYQVDFETDGEQHYTDERIIESDKRRTEFLKSKNIETIRVRWALFKKIKSINERKLFLENLIIDITTRKISEKTTSVLYSHNWETRITDYLIGKNTKYTHALLAIGFPKNCISSFKTFIKNKNFKLNTVYAEQEPKIKCEVCKFCGKPKIYWNPCCQECENKNIFSKPKKSKEKRPRSKKFEISKDELEKLISEQSFGNVGKMFGVTDNSIKKRCKTLGIDISLNKFVHKKHRKNLEKDS